LLQIQKGLHCKRNSQQSEETAYRWERISARYSPHRGLISTRYEGLKKNQQNNNLINKWAMELSRHFLNEEAQMIKIYMKNHH
jgi:hypothetical protein